MNLSVNLADIIAALIVLTLVLWGAKKGFMKASFSLGSLLLSLILALTLYPVVTDFLSDSAVGDYVRINVYNVLGADEIEATPEEELGSALNLPSAFTKTAKQVENTAKTALANTVSELALKLLGILIVFVLVKVTLWLILTIFDSVSKLPVIRTANKLMGALVGAVYGILVVYLLLAVLAFTTTLNATNKPTELVLESKYVVAMYHNNVLLNFLQ